MALRSQTNRSLTAALIALALIHMALSAHSQQNQRDSKDTIKSILAKKPAPPRKTVSSRRPTRRSAAGNSNRTASQKPYKDARQRPAAATTNPAKPTPPIVDKVVVAQGRTWTLHPGANLVEANKDGVRLNQSSLQNTLDFASASTAISLKGAPLWRISFEVRFLDLRSSGSCVRLLSTGRAIGLIGADGTTGSMTAFMAAASGPRYAQRVSDDWHECEMIGKESDASMWLDGVKVSEAAIPCQPDSIVMGPMGQAAGQQTSVAIRNVLATSAEDLPSGMELFNGRNLAGWTSRNEEPWIVADGHLKNPDIAAQPTLYTEFTLESAAFVLSMKLRVLSGIRTRIWLIPGEVGFGNEANRHGFQLIGAAVLNPRVLADGAYDLGRTYEIRIEADAAGNLALFRDGTIISSAHFTRKSPIRIALSAGDAFSAGRVEIESVRLWAKKR